MGARQAGFNTDGTSEDELRVASCNGRRAAGNEHDCSFRLLELCCQSAVPPCVGEENRGRSSPSGRTRMK